MADRRRSAGRWAGLALVVLLAGVACSDDEGLEPDGRDTPTSERPTTETTEQRPTSTERRESTTTTTSDETSSTTPPSDGDAPADEQEVIDRYLGFWQARWSANTGTPDPADPGLAEFATGEQLDASINEAEVNLERGLAYREADDPIDFQRVQVVSIEGDLAVLQECVVDDGLVVRIASGEVIDADVSTHNIRGELTRVEGVWRVSRIQPVQVWEGVAGCASGA